MDYLAFVTAILLVPAAFALWRGGHRMPGARRGFAGSLAAYLLLAGFLELWPSIWLGGRDGAGVAAMLAALRLAAAVLIVRAAIRVRPWKGQWIPLTLVAVLLGAGIASGHLAAAVAATWILVQVFASVQFWLAARSERGDFRRAFLALSMAGVLAIAWLPEVPVMVWQPKGSDVVISLLGMVAAAMWLWGAGTWYRAVVWKQLPSRRPEWNGPSARRGRLIALTFVVVLAAGWPGLGWLTGRVDGHLRGDLLVQSRLAMESLRSTPPTGLVGIRSDQDSPAYLNLKIRLADLAKVGDYGFVYLFVADGNSLRFLADSEPVGSPDESVIGDIWTTAPPELRDFVFGSGEDTLVVGPYTDEWGTWVSAIGKVPGWLVGDHSVWLGVDRSAAAWQEVLFRARQGGMAVIAAVLLLIVAAFLLHRGNLESEWRLADAEERWRHALKGAGLGAWEFDCSQRVFRTDDLLREQLGLEAGATHATLDDWTAAMEPESRRAFLEKWSRLEGALDEELETDVHIAHAGGTPLEIRLRGRIILRDTNGAPLLLSGTALDVTERNRNRALLKQQQEELRRMAVVAENTTNAVIITNARGEIEWVNPGFERITGYSLESIRGRRPGHVLQKEDMDPAVKARMHAAVREARGFKEIALNYSRDGRAYWVSIECQPLRDATGVHTGFMAIEEDITERVLAQRALEQQHRHLAKISDTLLHLGDDYEENLQSLTALAGELFGADCALYNRLEKNLLVSRGRYQAPDELPLSDEAEGHLCYDVIRHEDRFLYVANLFSTDYAETDPNVSKFQLDTYVGHGVQVQGETIGSLCVVFTRRFAMEDHLRECLSLVAQAIGREELLHMGREKLDQLARAEEAARVRISTLLQNLNDAVLVEDPERRVVFANPAFESMFGVPAADIVGRECAQLAKQAAAAFDDPRLFLESTESAVASGGILHGQVLGLRDGRFLLRNLAPIRDGEAFHGYLWHYRDITRQHRNERLLDAVARLASQVLEKPLDSQAAWQAAVEALGIPSGVDRVYVFRHHLHPETSRAACSQLAEWVRDGVSPQLENPDLQNVDYVAAGIGRWLELLQRDEAVTGTFATFPESERHLLDPQRIQSLVIVPIRVRGELWGFVGFDDCHRSRIWEQDELALLKSAAGLIQARLELQDSVGALVQSEAKLRTMFELSPVGMALNDLKTGAFLEVNQALCAMVGYSADEFQEVDFWSVTPLDYTVQEEASLDCLQEKGTFGPYEKEFIHKDGHRFPVLLNGLLTVDESGRERIWSIVQDISERKKWEESITAAREAADAANRAKSTFLATMSHEIRTPLNAIIGMSSLLAQSSLNSEQREYTQTIVSSGELLLDLINDILDYSKIEAGKIELEARDFELARVVVEPLEILGRSAAMKGVELSYHIDASVPPVLCGDRMRLQQVILNLVSNAIKFTPSGEVSLHVTPENLRGQPFFRIAVQDSGIGISPAAVAELFQPFQQADSSITRTFGGTGLGLAISKRLVELMGGDIGVESTPGRGSCFWIVIPARPGLVSGLAAETTEVGSLAGRRVMVVDDNPTNGRLLLDQCRLWNVEACVFEKPAEARDVLQADPTKWDLVLVDYEMPGMNGLAFAKSLAGLAIPPLVLLSSAFEMPSSVDRNLFADVLHKPVRPDVFRGLLKKWLSGSREKRPLRPAPAAGRRRKIRILVAEDNATNRKVVRSMLGVLGHSAVVVENGREAVAAAGAESFHLILLDVQMPEMDGLEAARQIRAFPPGEVGRPWIVALTANAFKEDREACLAAGMDDYLAKPVKLDDLRRLLETVGQTLNPETSEKR